MNLSCTELVPDLCRQIMDIEGLELCPDAFIRTEISALNFEQTFIFDTTLTAGAVTSPLFGTVSSGSRSILTFAVMEMVS